MTRTTTAPLSARIATCVAAVACLALSSAALAAGAESTIKYQPESLSKYQQQLGAGQIGAVTINKRVRSLRITLKDGSYVLARYAPHEEPKLAAALAAKGISPTILQPSAAAKEVVKKPVKHKLRYIVGGILVVVAVVVGAVLLIDRRRKLAAE